MNTNTQVASRKNAFTFSSSKNCSTLLPCLSPKSEQCNAKKTAKKQGHLLVDMFHSYFTVHLKRLIFEVLYCSLGFFVCGLNTTKRPSVVFTLKKSILKQRLPKRISAGNNCLSAMSWPFKVMSILWIFSKMHVVIARTVYTIQTSSRCDTLGYQFVTDKVECETASQDLGFDNSASVYQSDCPGCLTDYAGRL